MWYNEAVVYQIYPLGLCGAPLQNDGDTAQAEQHRLLRVLDWVDHIRELGATCVLFNPLFESDAHGYDTRDYTKVDSRLGTNEDLKPLSMRCTKPASGSCWTVFSTMWAAASGRSGMCRKKVGQPL